MQVGSIVRLKAGGPNMTVQAINWPGGEVALVKCIYIDAQGVLTRPIFPQPCMEEIKSKPAWNLVTGNPSPKYFLGWDGSRMAVLESENSIEPRLEGKTTFGWRFFGDNIYVEATHWMELPAPPEETPPMPRKMAPPAPKRRPSSRHLPRQGPHSPHPLRRAWTDQSGGCKPSLAGQGLTGVGHTQGRESLPQWLKPGDRPVTTPPPQFSSHPWQPCHPMIGLQQPIVLWH